MNTITPRPYQEEALQALHMHMCTRDTHPCVVIPTGGGKSVLMAWAIQFWKRDHSDFRAIILAHRKELVQQNSSELRMLWPEVDMGVYSAGLRRRDMDHSIIYASIDSVHKKGGEFAPFDVVIVDEAHRIPPSGEGKYRSFIKMQKIQNKLLRVVGFTATPYRMTGPLCHPDHILQEVCYEARINRLIEDGYLCKLWSRRGETQPDLCDVKRNSGGDYILASLAQAVDRKDIVANAVKDAVSIASTEKRKSLIFFCVDVSHCHRVSQELTRYNIHAPAITASTPARERDLVAEQFKSGRIRAICNVNVYTEGFNAKQVDCIVLLRPTLSRGLYVQMVGRGLRQHPNKSDCLVLDYAHCIDEHGPIDCIGEGDVALYECASCRNMFSRQIRTCPICGWTIPKQEIERLEAEDRERRLHEIRASNKDILSGDPVEIEVNAVRVHRHTKPGRPDSLRVEYRCGLSVIREWICLDHDGLAGQKAHTWWRRRFPSIPVPTVEGATQDMFLETALTRITKSITFVQKGKYREIISYHLVGG